MKITGDNKTNVLLTYDNLVSLSINDDSKSTVELDGIYDLVQPLLLTAIMTAVNEITLTYDSALDETSIPDLIDFVCDYSGGAMEVSGVVVSGSTVVLTTDIPVTYNTTLSLAYIPGSSPIKSASGVNASAFSEAVDLSIVAELFPNGNSDDLILSDVTSSSIRLDWINGSTDETAISIERKTDIVEWAEIKTLAAGTKYYIDDTCDSSTNYYYRVRAEKTGYYSDYSNQENETTLASGPDGDCSGLTLSVISDTQINLSWTNGFTNHAAVSIERKLTTGGTFAEIFVTSDDATTYNNTGLSEITGYTYRVRAILGGNYSNYSNEASEWTLSTRALAFFAEMATQPTAATKALVQLTFRNLKTKGLLSNTIDQLVLPLHTSEASLRNWIKTAHIAELVNAPTFNAGIGYGPLNGLTQYIKPNYTPRTEAVNYTLNSCFFGLYLYNTSVNSATIQLNGGRSSTADGGAANRIQLSRPHQALEAYSFRSNNNDVACRYDVVERSTGFYYWTRTTNLIVRLFKDKVLKLGLTNSATTKIPDRMLYIGCENVPLVNDVPTLFTKDQVSGWVFARGLTDQEADDLNDIVAYHMANIQATL